MVETMNIIYHLFVIILLLSWLTEDKNISKKLIVTWFFSNFYIIYLILSII